MNPHRHVRTPLEARFGTLNGLMRALALAGLAGQEHLMNKMLVLLRREVLRLVSPIGAPDLSRLADAMTDLEHEAGRFAARPSIFNGHVSTAIDVLARSSNLQELRTIAAVGAAVHDGEGPRLSGRQLLQDRAASPLV
jgi:hypothetical protein